MAQTLSEKLLEVDVINTETHTGRIKGIKDFVKCSDLNRMSRMSASYPSPQGSGNYVERE